MNKDQRDIQRKFQILRYAEEVGYVSKSCWYFGIGKSSFYRGQRLTLSAANLINALPVPRWHPNRTPYERGEKVIYLRRKYQLGPMRIIRYSERGHDIKIPNATVSRILRLRGLNRLPSGTRTRKGQTNCYQKRVLGHHIQLEVKLQIFKGKRGKRCAATKTPLLMMLNLCVLWELTKSKRQPTS